MVKSEYCSVTEDPSLVLSTQAQQFTSSAATPVPKDPAPSSGPHEQLNSYAHCQIKLKYFKYLRFLKEFE